MKTVEKVIVYSVIALVATMAVYSFAQEMKRRKARLALEATQPVVVVPNTETV